MTVFSYTMAFDRGFAPNPYNGVMTLACCKGNIRRAAVVGDLILGFCSVTCKLHQCGLIYVMQVTSKLDYEDYMRRTSEFDKVPSWDGDPGDQIYHVDEDDEVYIRPSWHTDANGGAVKALVEMDWRGKYVLLSTKFWYFGREAIELPEALDSKYHRRRIRGHIKIDGDGTDLKQYLLGSYGWGIHGLPHTIAPDPDS